MAKKDIVESVATGEAAPDKPAGVDAAEKPDGGTASPSPEQLQLLSTPPDAMVQQILDRQAVFGF